MPPSHTPFSLLMSGVSHMPLHSSFQGASLFFLKKTQQLWRLGVLDEVSAWLGEGPHQGHRLVLFSNGEKKEGSLWNLSEKRINLTQEGSAFLT